MKIVICGSMKVCKKMIEVKEKLVKLNHTVILPRHTEEYAEMDTLDQVHKESAKNKINDDLIRDYYHEISKNEAVLIVNKTLNEIENYIGGNSFLEIGFAHILNKRIYLMNGIPEMIYKDEIIAMQPVIINGDLKLIK